MGNAGYEGVVSAYKLDRDSGLEYFFVRTESVCIRFLDAGGTDLKQIGRASCRERVYCVV